MSQNINLIETAFQAIKFFVPFLFALCFHEFAHGMVALWRGDRTAKIMGRLTLNPAAHADPIGTVFLPLLAVITHIPMFGWAKPVPVDERNLKNPRTDMFWIAAAGPLSNLLLALVGAVGMGVFIAYHGVSSLEDKHSGMRQIFDVINIFISINVFLAVFNMIPLHPLDGGKVLARFLPERVNRQLEEWQTYSSMLLLLLFISGAMAIVAYPASFVSGVFREIAYLVANLF